MHTVRLKVTRHVGTGKTEVAWRGGQVGGAARGLQIQTELGVLGSGRAAVVRGELQRQLTRREDLKDLGERESPGRRVFV